MELSKDCAVCGKSFVKPQTCSRRVWEKRRCCSLECGHALKRGRPNPRLGDANRGKKQSPEVVAKRAAGLKRAHAEGRMHVIDNTGLHGEQTSQWKGDDISYRTAHARLTGERGKPTRCELCGTEGGWIEWALKHDAEVVKIQSTGTGTGMRYSPRATDYFPACRPCHRVYDGRERDARTGRYL